MTSDPSFSSKEEEEDEMSDREADFEWRSHGHKRRKMRDMESVLRVEGVVPDCSLDSLFLNEAKVLGNQHTEDGNAEVNDATTSVFLEKFSSGTAATSSVERVSACLTLGSASNTHSLNLGNENLPESVKEFSRESFPTEANKESDQNGASMVGLGLDLNSHYPSSTAEHNPFYPYKKLEEIKSADASESGSTTGPIEESEPLRRWRQMKQNGFLSSSHGGIPMPKQQNRQSRKRKYDKLQSKIEFAKREQINRFAKIAAPSGLLSGLNPGIINHVRNSKQVHSIIEAMVRSEKHEDQMQNGIVDQIGRGSRETGEIRKDHICTHDTTTTNKPIIQDIVRRNLHQGRSATSELTSECEDDALTLKLSSATTLVSENASSGTPDEFSANHESLDSLSLQAANVASQWLDLLQQDIKGRLAALRRSKKRVKNVIQTELPYLLSKEFISNQENEPYFIQATEASYSTKEISEMHVVRWRSIFSQMDKALYEEGKQLESWLKQVQEMQLHCENGLKFAVSGGSSHLTSSNDSSKLKKSDVLKRECAVWAAAASIYSTCNWITGKEKMKKTQLSNLYSDRVFNTKEVVASSLTSFFEAISSF